MGKRVPVVIFGTAALAVVTPAQAVPPTLSSVTHQNRHPIASFSAPRSDFAAIYLASKPDRATDGNFLQENIKEADLLTDSEIQEGRWSDESQIDPGTYWVMLKASPDFDACYIFGSGGFDPTCADGFSNVLTLAVPKPAILYRAKVTAYRSINRAYLELSATPLGETVPYRVCYRLKSRRAQCLKGTLDGYSWDSPGTDSLTVNTRNLATVTTFTWYVAGKAVATKRVRVH